MSASAHGAKRVRTPIDRVHRRIGATCSNASFAERARADDPKGPRYTAPSSLGAARTTLMRGHASAGSIFR